MPNKPINDLLAYIAIGDSMSIDLYPANDLNEDPDEPLGSAALLYSNHDRIWPGFTGRDLKTFNPKMRFANLCVDGATTWDLLEPTSLNLVQEYKDKPVLVTMTIGGNDMLSVVRRPETDIMSVVADVVLRINRIADELAKRFPQAIVIMNTVYDPSDGTGELPYMPNFADKLPFLRYVNHEIEKTAQAHKFLFADPHTRFQGHGVKAEDSFYWKSSPIEPSALGASALRGLWLEVLAEAKII